MRGTLTRDERATFLVDSSQPYFIALSDPLWRGAGLDGRASQADPTRPDVRGAPLPLMRLAGFELPQVPALSSGAITNGASTNVDVDLGGVIGASLISAFRVTFGDEGRFIWMEPDLTQQMQADARAQQSSQPQSSQQQQLTPPSSSGAPMSPMMLNGGSSGKGSLGNPAP